jgi:hypothetical protein
MLTDVAYFNSRALEELEAAERAENANARAAHLELAARYKDLAEAIDRHGRFLNIRS